MSKQTAVEWLVEKLSYSQSDGTIISHHFIITELVEQAKQMEKEQIIDAYDMGYLDYQNLTHDSSQEYFNETYGGTDEN